MKAYIYLENGVFLQAKASGKGGTISGEMVFNTSMSGYQEIITDPSYAGQFIVFTAPEIGIVGCNNDDMESFKIHACGLFVRRLNEFSSNYRSKSTLSEFVSAQNKIIIHDINTRALTKMIREKGVLRAVISTQISTKSELAKVLENSARIEEIDLVEQVTTKMQYSHDSGIWDFESNSYSNPVKIGKKVAVIDYGVKRNILNELSSVGLDVEVYPSSVQASVLIDAFNTGNIQGVFLSNGPGDPRTLKDEIEQIKKLIEAKVPMFGICLGHQLLSNAFGYETYKLKFGQHGSNHPVQNLQTNTVEITSQNHNYNVPESIAEIATITHRNLFDGTIEGLRYKDAPIFSVQYHPESSAGPHESEYLFKEFLEILSDKTQHQNVE